MFHLKSKRTAKPLTELGLRRTLPIMHPLSVLNLRAGNVARRALVRILLPLPGRHPVTKCRDRDTLSAVLVPKRTHSGREHKDIVNQMNRVDHLQARVNHSWNMHRLELTKCRSKSETARKENPSSSKIAMVGLAGS